MYLRFVTPLIHPRSRVESGFFRASWYIHQTDCPDWIRQELSDQFRWFSQHLPIPGRIARHFKRRDSIWGVGYAGGSSWNPPGTASASVLSMLLTTELTFCSAAFEESRRLLIVFVWMDEICSSVSMR